MPAAFYNARRPGQSHSIRSCLLTQHPLLDGPCLLLVMYWCWRRLLPDTSPAASPLTFFQAAPTTYAKNPLYETYPHHLTPFLGDAGLLVFFVASAGTANRDGSLGLSNVMGVPQLPAHPIRSSFPDNSPKFLSNLSNCIYLISRAPLYDPLVEISTIMPFEYGTPASFPCGFEGSFFSIGRFVPGRLYEVPQELRSLL